MGRCIGALAVAVVGLAAVGSAWGALAKAPAGIVVKVGLERAFTTSQLRPGTSVSCVDDGHVLSVTVPASRAVSTGTVWTQAGTRHFHLNVDARSGGYVVSCGLGAIHWVAAPASATRQPAHVRHAPSLLVM
jgi:hypothetical protein